MTRGFLWNVSRNELLFGYHWQQQKKKKKLYQQRPKKLVQEQGAKVTVTPRSAVRTSARLSLRQHRTPIFLGRWIFHYRHHKQASNQNQSKTKNQQSMLTILDLGIEKEEALFFRPINSLEAAVIKMQQDTERWEIRAPRDVIQYLLSNIQTVCKSN